VGARAGGQFGTVAMRTDEKKQKQRYPDSVAFEE
jgi:hypothetical protein